MAKQWQLRVLPFAMLALSLFTVSPSPVFSQSAPPSGLGRIDFPTSSAVPAAQQAFLQGVLLLHSFEYARALRAFQEAQRLEPGFAMAHWGEAMTHTHPVWNEQDRAAARAALERLGSRADLRVTARERGYLAAVEALYGEGSKPRRDTLYAGAMERLVREFPGDLEAKAFYALALLGLNQGIRDTVTYLRAAPYADSVFRANPNHPGAVHYLIHAWDDPLHASLGLPAARAYIDIAPDAAHAQHMTTHIFLALGMWAEVVAQNTVAMKLQAELPGHYTSWLAYGLIQQGRLTEARELIQRLDRNLGGGGNHMQHSALGSMWAHYFLEAGRWDDSLVGRHAGHRTLTPIAALGETYVKGRLAYTLRQRDPVKASLADATRLAGVLREEREAGDPGAMAARVMVAQLTGLVHLLENSPAMGLRALRAAAALEDSIPMEFGPPVIVEPSHELLGYVLSSDDPGTAVQEFERADRMAPGRSRMLRGLAIASYEARDKARMRAALDRLDRNHAGADPARRRNLEGLRTMLERMP